MRIERPAVLSVTSATPFVNSAQSNCALSVIELKGRSYKRNVTRWTASRDDSITLKENVMAIDNAVYTAHATSVGGRTGHTKTSDSKIDVQLSTPKELGGDSGPGTNPEQLFAAGYSACFIGAMKAVAAQQKLHLPNDVSIDAEVSIGAMTGKPGAFGIEVSMTVTVPGMDHDAAQALVAAAHEVCPYSNATRGNLDVKLHVA